MVFILFTILLILILVVLGILFYSYRKLKKKNRHLYLHIKANDAVPSDKEKPVPYCGPEPSLLSADIRQRELFMRLHTYLLTNKNFARPNIDTHMLISELSTNRSYLFEAVKSATGKTLQEYITSLRLEESKHLLETTDEIIENIAGVCGYSSVRTFYRLFRSYYHISPAMYRKMAREQNPGPSETHLTEPTSSSLD